MAMVTVTVTVTAMVTVTVTATATVTATVTAMATAMATATGTEAYPSCAALAVDACGGDNGCATDAVPSGWVCDGPGARRRVLRDAGRWRGLRAVVDDLRERSDDRGLPTSDLDDLGGLDTANGGDDEQPEHAARVNYYGLDRYEVSVARMRAFIDAYDKPTLLAALGGGAGQHPTIAGSDWQNGWDNFLPATAADLETSLDCDPSGEPGLPRQGPTRTTRSTA